MNIYVYIDVLHLTNDEVVTKLLLYPDGYDDPIINYQMSDGLISSYGYLANDPDYIVGDFTLNEYDDDAYSETIDELKLIIESMVSSFNTAQLNWYIVNWYIPDDVRFIFSKILNIDTYLNSKFIGIDDLLQYANCESYDDQYYIDWIFDNRDALHTDCMRADQICTSITLNLSNGITISKEEIKSDEEILNNNNSLPFSMSPHNILRLVKYGYILMKGGK